MGKRRLIIGILSMGFYSLMQLVQRRHVRSQSSLPSIVRLPRILDLEDARQDGVKSCLSFHQQLIQSRLTQTLGLNAGLQSTVNSVLEQSTSQVLQQFAHLEPSTPQFLQQFTHARALPVADPSQQSAPQSGCNSFSASQLQNYCACLEFVDAHTSHPLYSLEQPVPSELWLTSYDASGSLQLPTINNELFPELISADSSLFCSTLPPNDYPFAEPPQDIWDLSQGATEDLAVSRFEQQDFRG
jgi:hypothetical protein